MINFFRRIRKKLANDNKPLKYMRYAIGEIVLVVIGILLALQVNNWNEWRKERLKEVVLLEGLTDNLQNNIFRLDGALDNHRLGIASANYIISVLEGREVYTDSVDQMFNWAFYSNNLGTLTSVGFEALKDAGFDVISDRTLREEIRSLFEVTYRNMYGRYEWTYTEMWEDYLDKHFIVDSPKGGTPVWKPYNFNFQMEDHYFLSNIYKFRLQRRWQTGAVETSLSETKRVLQLSKAQLDQE